jgi:hypothetical protein
VPDDQLWSAVKGAMTLIAADTAWNVTQGSVTCVIGRLKFLKYSEIGLKQ